jgi:hypothetical protein
MDGADDVLLEELKASERLDIQRGLEWCDDELRAASWLDVRRRLRVVLLRRRWARRWRAATGHPAASVRRQRTWRLAAALGVAGVVALVVAAGDRTAPSPEATSAPAPAPTASAAAPLGVGSDAAAMRRALALAITMRRCRPAPTPRGESCEALAARHSSGETGVAEAGRGYEVHVRSGSGNVFGVTARPDDGTIVRWCQTPAIGGCPASGTW